MKRLRPVIDEPTLIAYYCKACEKIVKGLSKGKNEKYSFTCPTCQNDCIYGTARSLIHVLKIKEASENGKILIQMQQEKLRDLGLPSPAKEE